MAVKLTKNELKIQKDRLKQFEHFLPSLQLKKQQLQSVVRQVRLQLEQKYEERNKMIGNLDDWVDVFSENTSFNEKKKLEKLVVPDSVNQGMENIAGVQVPFFNNLVFKQIDYNVEDYPLWVDTAIVKLREIASLDAYIKILKIRVDKLEAELRTTSQRVNLFEKVKIPQTKQSIKRIFIYLGDQQTSAVVRGKIAKKKLNGGVV